MGLDMGDPRPPQLPLVPPFEGAFRRAVDGLGLLGEAKPVLFAAE